LILLRPFATSQKLTLSKDYPDSFWILSADRSIIRGGYPAYPPQVWASAGGSRQVKEAGGG